MLWLVLFAVPFGLICAVLGHAIMGYTMSFVSVLGLVARSGVVINESLVAELGLEKRGRLVEVIGAVAVALIVWRGGSSVLSGVLTFGALAASSVRSSRDRSAMETSAARC